MENYNSEEIILVFRPRDFCVCVTMVYETSIYRDLYINEYYIFKAKDSCTINNFKEH